jgi:DNA-binding transcriptional regulator YiaG
MEKRFLKVLKTLEKQEIRRMRKKIKLFKKKFGSLKNGSTFAALFEMKVKN